MLKGFTVTNPKGESLFLELRNPESSGLIIKDITGLGPEGADILITDMATTDGGIFTGARRPVRNIVITLMFMFKPTIEDARLKTYTFFPLKKKVKLVFETDRRLAEIEGYVESNTPEIFSKEETAVISLLCPDPNFYMAGSEFQLFSGVQPRFEFPFSNESLTENLIEFGELILDNRVTFDYSGDSDAGMLITIHMLGGADHITLWNTDTREKIELNTTKIASISGKPLEMYDDILISTVQGNKYVQLLRKGTYYNIIGALEKDSDWPQVTNGKNTYAFTADKGEENILIIFSYKTAYGGI